MEKKLWGNWLFTFMLLMFSSCEHEEMDWRDTYIGKWEFTSVVYSNNWNYMGEHSIDTVIYSGSIIKGSADSSVFVHFAPSSINDFYLNPIGELYTPRLVTEYHYNRIVYGSFSSANNVTFTLQSGGQGSNQMVEVFGKRIKNG